jgi:FtsP/CotA-like multicopper oxidase with cupredoxin domain
MLLLPIDYFLFVWFVLAAASSLYVAWDQFRNNPEPTVMRWAFILITLYMGPLGLLIYVLADKEPQPGTHEQFIKPLWKQGIGSTIHRIAGDATGIILAAVITAILGLPMKYDLIVEYLAGFSFGLFIFQSLFMKNMMGGSYWQNVRMSFLPEFISMNFMMAAMAPVMSFLMMGRDMRAMEPTQLVFWGVMSLGVTAGFIFAYPSNVWMVKRGLKHGLMTERKPNTKFARYADHSEHHSEDHSKHEMGKSDATVPQRMAVGFVSLLALITGLIAPANYLNLSLSAHQIGGLMMPRGMIMDRDTPADAMRDMSFVNPKLASASFDVQQKGDQELQPHMDGTTKVFDLDASVIRWHILPNVAVDAYAYNQQIPGPRLHFKQGDHVRINVHNHLPEATTVHWHGLIVPNQMDGPGDITQKPILPGQTYAYEFTAQQAGTYFYHPHYQPDRQQALGLYGAIIIDPTDPARDDTHADHEYVVQLQEWLVREGLTYPAMFMEGGLANYFTINGKAYPSTDTVHMKVGETLKVRFIGTNNNFVHPMHIHGGPFTVVARDGNTLEPSARYGADTVNVAPGQRYDVVWLARKPGKWLIHCHIPHHTANNNVEEHGGGGLMLIIEVSS